MATLNQRYKLLYTARDNTDLQNKLIFLCKKDILFWFDHFCWTFDPRTTPSELPFNLMDFQRQTVLLMSDCIKGASRIKREDLLIEKSRDMGISWLIAMTFHYFWMFYPGYNFMIGSRKEDDVDKKGDLSSFMEKIRFNASFQPKWLCPKLGKSEDNYLKLIHPLNRNTITGESSTAGFARGKRYRAICIDEMAFHPYGKQAYETAWQSTYCMILPSTPNGKLNEFYKLRSRETVEWIDIEGDSTSLDVA